MQHGRAGGGIAEKRKSWRASMPAINVAAKDMAKAAKARKARENINGAAKRKRSWRQCGES